VGTGGEELAGGGEDGELGAELDGEALLGRGELGLAELGVGLIGGTELRTFSTEV
jgi:hypothetical protein